MSAIVFDGMNAKLIYIFRLNLHYYAVLRLGNTFKFEFDCLENLENCIHDFYHVFVYNVTQYSYKRYSFVRNIFFIIHYPGTLSHKT